MIISLDLIAKSFHARVPRIEDQAPNTGCNTLCYGLKPQGFLSLTGFTNKVFIPLQQFSEIVGFDCAIN
jgi:hypothetical protein